jgi:hypothetical protein
VRPQENPIALAVEIIGADMAPTGAVRKDEQT